MNQGDRIRLFGLSAGLAERELDKIEKRLALDLQRSDVDDKDEDYYPQFDYAFRSEAQRMAGFYELFYCLERSLRRVISATLESMHGEAWWDKCVPSGVRDNVALAMRQETDAGVTARSDEEIDYATFGELSSIAEANWDSLGAVFRSRKAFLRIMATLNALRNPIAHCCPIAEDESIRLKLAVRDWFRLME
jgi:hypothetical protein